jgi:hypothetical protein
MAFNIFVTQRISCIAQYDRIDDLIPCKLRSDKRPVFRQYLVDEFHSSTVFEGLNPFLVWHSGFSRRGQFFALVLGHYFVVLNFWERCGHLFLLLKSSPVISYLPTRFPDYFSLLKCGLSKLVWHAA